MSHSNHRWPLHRKLATVGWTCLGAFAFILIADEIAKRLSLPRVEQWPLIGLCAAMGMVPSLLAGSVCLLLAPIARQHYNRAHTSHLCAHCEYDRRGLEPGVPCPECGNAPFTPPPTGA